ncbi:hypothetical protein MLD38_021318 [Melastoma candidum]|uniref:Uncharacterized protein n=1 Tax=Melastoma candidum TaxID=119954 RepID=A0ACB9QFY9_9MYRT|nr:hypothetical protein MLD38_021318 [Melastoma candidum]
MSDLERRDCRHGPNTGLADYAWARQEELGMHSKVRGAVGSGLETIDTSQGARGTALESSDEETEGQTTEGS